MLDLVVQGPHRSREIDGQFGALPVASRPLALSNIAGTGGGWHPAAMGAETEKPVWERIAEMGFADAVESKGFKRVNATHWKMESEGLTWRVRLVQGY
ncbi:hypothetical protein [Minwuia thermotolerans]|uniref:hypothetical protein n=1 Tax=Minwuia thermotolerans TaxID=2056226 RepID=UPI000F640655|nr:hypothetical protein [Minwuia thermotolerans]